MMQNASLGLLWIPEVLTDDALGTKLKVAAVTVSGGDPLPRFFGLRFSPFPDTLVLELTTFLGSLL